MSRLFLLLLCLLALASPAHAADPTVRIAGIQLRSGTYPTTTIVGPQADQAPAILLTQDLPRGIRRLEVVAYLVEQGLAGPAQGSTIATYDNDIGSQVLTTKAQPVALTGVLPFGSLVSTRPLYLLVLVYVYFEDGTEQTTSSRTLLAPLMPLAPLPVRLVSFTGVRSAAATKLHWTVAQEVNISRYEIETSATGTDFHPVGFVAAAHQPEYTYSIAAGSPSYYVRLRIVELDGSSSYSPLVFIAALGQQQQYLLTVGSRAFAFPLAPQAVPARFIWRDLSGRVVGVQLVGAAAPSTPGVYVVTLETQTSQHTTRRVLVE
jgi:hypothetical protein